MSFIVSGLPVETFQPLFHCSEAALAERGVVRVTAGADGRYPCRVTLEDARPRDTLLLLNFESHSASTPYRSAYAIYVNEAAGETRRVVDDVPPVLRGRPIALRVFDEDGMLISACLALNDDVKERIEQHLADPAVAYIHAHNAAAGCFAALIERA
jgi:hypothetical protein